MTVPGYQHELPIFARPRRTWAQSLNGFLFFMLFIPGCFMVHVFQLSLLPLKLLSWSTWAGKLYDEGIRYAKGTFATLMSE